MSRIRPSSQPSITVPMDLLHPGFRPGTNLRVTLTDAIDNVALTRSISLGPYQIEIVESLSDKASIFTDIHTYDRFWRRFQISISRTANPRNAEAPWKPTFHQYFLSLFSAMHNLDIEEEQSFNSIESHQAAEALKKTVTAQRGLARVVTPDIRARLSFAHDGETIYFFPFLHELKRAASRLNTIFGYPVLGNPVHTDDGKREIVRLLKRAMIQVEYQAVICFDSTSQLTHCQHEILLIASAGPWITLRIASRVGDGRVENFSEQAQAEFQYLQDEYSLITTTEEGEERDWVPEDSAALAPSEALPPVTAENRRQEITAFQNLRLNIPAIIDHGLLFTASDWVDNYWSIPVMLGTKAGDHCLQQVKSFVGAFSKNLERTLAQSEGSN
ncbi:hypothetical protein BT96DRAFT_1027357 [Gymnopus androsaceus JB14]|uniref:Uncharacterized protein n=1 Tax=Gymnopus androsaceus JB14 TaxID=1447944 RepID=A0A6A4GCD3_9AGAR|nr:hypothetical protein BT96DRAFT_1027357 [Gymnopus androsaceus JB14]